jgi:type IV pilus assembly protein PilQ
MKTRSQRLALFVCTAVLTVVTAVPIAWAVDSRDTPLSVPRPRTTTFHFSNMPVRTALELIAEEGHFNLVLSDSVQGSVTLYLHDVTWEQALEVVLRLKGLHQRVDGATLWVSSSAEQ